jgi:hypothetical protein
MNLMIDVLTPKRQFHFILKTNLRPLYLGENRKPTKKERLMEGRRFIHIDFGAIRGNSKGRFFQTWRNKGSYWPAESHSMPDICFDEEGRVEAYPHGTLYEHRPDLKP